MKKLVIAVLAVLTLTAGIAQAQPRRKTSEVLNKLNRYVVRQFSQIFAAKPQMLPWAQAVKESSQKAVPSGFLGVNLKFVAAYQSPAVPKNLEKRHQAHVQAIDNALHGNKIVNRFHVKWIHSQDIASLSDTTLKYVTDFFAQPVEGETNIRVTPVSVQQFERYFVRVTLRAPGTQRPIYLTFNCFTKEMFLSHTPTLPHVQLEPLTVKAPMR